MRWVLLWSLSPNYHVSDISTDEARSCCVLGSPASTVSLNQSVSASVTSPSNGAASTSVILSSNGAVSASIMPSSDGAVSTSVIPSSSGAVSVSVTPSSNRAGVWSACYWSGDRCVMNNGDNVTDCPAKESCIQGGRLSQSLNTRDAAKLFIEYRI